MKKVIMVTLFFLPLATGGCGGVYHTERSPTSALSGKAAVNLWHSLGFQVLPQTHINIINNLAAPILVEGTKLPLQPLRPGERVTVTFKGYPGRQEVAYFAYAIDRAGNKTGAVATAEVRLARRGVRHKTWRISHLREPRR